MTDEERFWKKVFKTSTCWVWTASLRQSGYGQFRLGGKIRRAHIVAYEFEVGPVPAGLELDHTCRILACVNPAHLEPVTHAENCRRGNVGKFSRDKTHCPQGHAYDKVNTYVTPGGKRHCRTCKNERKRLARRSRP